MRRPSFAGIFVVLFALARGDDGAKDPPLLFSDDFTKGADRWEPSDANAWKVIETKRGKVYSQFRQSKYNPPHRSPFNFSLVKDLNAADLVLEARVQSTVKDYPHRDVCVFFGYQDSAHFYYVHLGKKTDDHASQIFIVNGESRKKFSTKTTEGTNWDDEWHHVKVVRHVGDGTIEVYFDDMKKPVMTAKDKTFTWGRAGIGSFDDTANWADVRVYGTKAKKIDRGP
jgi:hypothetical protein